MGNNTAVEQTTETKQQQNANKAFQNQRSIKRRLHDSQEILKHSMLEDKDYAQMTEESKELNANKRSMKERLIKDHPDIRKKHEEVTALKKELKESTEVVKEYGIQSIRDGEQLSLFDKYEGREYRFNVDPRFTRIPKDHDKNKPVIEKIADDISKDQKKKKEGIKKMES